MDTKLKVAPENAEKFMTWIKGRGGIAVWNSINLSNPGASWSTPALQEDGQPYTKPSWQADNTPSRVITDPADVEVSIDREVKRFHVAVRYSRNGLSLKVTDASSRKIHAAVDKAGDGAYYRFDYETQEAVIMRPESSVPLTEWIVRGTDRESNGLDSRELT